MPGAGGAAARPQLEEGARRRERACDASGLVREDPMPDPTTDISAALRRVSPRLQRPRIAVRSVVIYGLVLGLWLAVGVAGGLASIARFVLTRAVADAAPFATISITGGVLSAEALALFSK